jgi:small-conductance mechanosensitive channel
VASARRLRWPEWVNQADAWRRRLGSELVLLPDTLKHLREAVENFRQATDPETVGHLRQGVENFQRATDPETLDHLREAVENFRRVTQRLVTATAGIEQVSKMQSGWNEVRQRVEEANRALRDQGAVMPGSDRVTGALQELNESLARWNPFWPRPPRRDET